MTVRSKVITGNVYDKYHTPNPIEQRLVAGFQKQLASYVESLPAMHSILEVGCGEGYMADYVQKLRPDAHISATDIDEHLVAEASHASPRVSFVVADVYALPWQDETFDLSIAAEVLEHLEKPTAALAEIRRVTRRYLLASVPNEPLWRILNSLTGRYLRNLGNTPGHIQHWNKARFKELLEAQFRVIEAATPLPWIMILAEKRL